MAQITLSTRIVTPRGEHGRVSHPYTTDVGERRAYVRLDDGREQQWSISRGELTLESEYRPAPRGPLPRAQALTTGEQALDRAMAQRRADIARAHYLHAQGLSLYAIALELRRTKEWLREYAGLR